MFSRFEILPLVLTISIGLIYLISVFLPVDTLAAERSVVLSQKIIFVSCFLHNIILPTAECWSPTTGLPSTAASTQTRWTWCTVC